MSGTLVPMGRAVPWYLRYRGTGQYPSKFKNLGYRVPRKFQKSGTAGYRVPRKFQKMGTAGYRVPRKFHKLGTAGYRVPRKFQKLCTVGYRIPSKFQNMGTGYRENFRSWGPLGTSQIKNSGNPWEPGTSRKKFFCTDGYRVPARKNGYWEAAKFSTMPTLVRN